MNDWTWPAAQEDGRVGDKVVSKPMGLMAVPNRPLTPMPRPTIHKRQRKSGPVEVTESVTGKY